ATTTLSALSYTTLFRSWSSTRETFTTKGLGTDNGADLIAVNVSVAHLDTAGDVLDTTIHPAVNTEGQAIALGINRIHYLIDVLRSEEHTSELQSRENLV